MTTNHDLRGNDNAPIGINYNALANFLLCRSITGIPHPFRIKRQLARTRHHCKTIVNGKEVKL